MKINFNIRCIMALILLAGMFMNPSFSQEERPQDTYIPYKEPNSGFKQLKNSEMIERYSDMNEHYRRVDSNTHPYHSNPPDEWMKVRQGQCNLFLLILLWNYYQVDMVDWFSGNLDMSGLQKLEWVVKTNKTIYQPGEPVGISISLRNFSTEDVRFCGGYLPTGFFIISMLITKIQKDDKQEVYLTKEGYRLYGNYEGFFDLSLRQGHDRYLQPGDMGKVYHTFQTLNHYYDLSEAGEYELTFYTRNFLADDKHQIGEYPKPCTIRFKIEGNTDWLDKQVVWPEEEK